MRLKTVLHNRCYEFGSLKEVLAKANEEKSGDRLAGIAAGDETERIAARLVLAELTLKDIRENPVVPYETDEVTRVIQDSVDEEVYREFHGRTLGGLREYVLSAEGTEIARLSRGLTSEMIAGLAKLMSNLDLVYAAGKITVTAHCNTTIGLKGTFSSRLQPNHSSDSIYGIMASLKEGISYGVGDAVIGLNPVEDSLENVKRILTAFREFTDRWSIPTQNCVLSHITTQMEALKAGAPMDLMFQSLAGSGISNRAFGTGVSMLDEGYAMMKELASSAGPNYMYFETGQGSELSSEGDAGVDQVTMEARCYGLAKRYDPFLVNTVVGFLGPEYLYDARQVIRAGLEDHFMGKLTGLPMGVDVCYTNHMRMDQNDLETLALLLVSAGCVYFMGVPATDDVMLMYQTTGYHDIAALREISGKRPIREFEKRMEEFGILRDGRLTGRAGDPSIFREY